MFLLLFFVLIIQFLTFWIFAPLVSFLEYVLEIRFFPLIALVGLIFLFSIKNIEKNKKNHNAG
tara:strand:- start:351 stop:539 length:189 start_codon:yes stop_codon:yes gene_type:complete